MYREEYKRRFIDERSEEVILPMNYLNVQFEKVSEMESKLNKDVCNFTYYEILEYYKLLNRTSINSLRVLNSQFSIYTQWCLQQNLVVDSQNHFLEIRTEDYAKCVTKVLFNKKIVSKDVVLQWVDELENAKDRFILLGLFEGIKGKEFCELANLRPEDINGNIATLCTEREVIISDKLRSIIDDCISEEFYYPINGSHKTKMIDVGYVIKNYCNVRSDQDSFQRGRMIYTSLRKIFQYFGIYPMMTAKDLYESGKIDMIKQCAAARGMSNIDYINSKNLKEVENQYKCTFRPKAEYINKHKDYLE